MFSVKPIIGNQHVNNIQLLNPQGKYIEIIHNHKKCFLITEHNEFLKKDEIGLPSNIRQFLSVVFDEKILIIYVDDIDFKKRILQIDVKVFGNKLEPTYEQVRIDFENIKYKLEYIPICPNVKYFFYCSTNAYTFTTNMDEEYSFIDDVIIDYKIKQNKLDLFNSTTLAKAEYVKSNNYELKSIKNRKHSNCESSDSSELFNGNFNFEELGVGGLDEEFRQIFRTCFASRILASESESMGTEAPKGILLYGAPGCGKTLIAKQLAKILKAKSCQLINGPELKNKYIGQSAENTRTLFKQAEEDQLNEIPGLHVIIFDEFDAIGGRRSGRDDAGSSNNNDIVNQLLSKIEGVEALKNIFIVAMTNRKEMLDPALLRSGRIEIHIEIKLPNLEGRRKIFEIHTKKSRDNKHIGSSVEFNLLSEMTTNYSGAEIKSVCSKAATYPLTKLIDPKTMKRIVGEKPIIEMNDFTRAIQETIPIMGSVSKEIELLIKTQLDLSNENFNKTYNELLNSVTEYFINGNSKSNSRNFTILIYGKSFSGKTILVANAVDQFMSMFSHVNFITPEKHMNECNSIWNEFQEGKRSTNFLFVIDSIETIFDYSVSGIIPDKTRQLLTILTSSVDSAKKVVTILTCSDIDMVNCLKLKNKVTLYLEI